MRLFPNGHLPLAAEKRSTVDTTVPTNIFPGTLAAVWDTES